MTFRRGHDVLRRSIELVMALTVMTVTMTIMAIMVIMIVMILIIRTRIIIVVMIVMSMTVLMTMAVSMTMAMMMTVTVNVMTIITICRTSTGGRGASSILRLLNKLTMLLGQHVMLRATTSLTLHGSVVAGIVVDLLLSRSLDTSSPLLV